MAERRIKVSRRSAYAWAQFLLPLSLLLAIAGLRASGATWVRLAQYRAFDAFQRRAPRPYQDAGVRVVDIDDDSLAKLGQFPWPRKVLARLTDRLAAAGAAAIVFDVDFPEPDRLGRDQDQAFARSLSRAPSVLGVALTYQANDKRPLRRAGGFAYAAEDLTRYVPTFSGARVNLPLLERSAAGVGSITNGYDPDGVIRRVPLVEQVGDTEVPLLALEALRVAQGARQFLVLSAVKERKGEGGLGIAGVRVGRMTLPTDENGYFWVRYTSATAARVIPAWQVLDKRFDPARVSGCIIFVGTSAEGLKDLRVTPLDPTTPGVMVHANVVEQAVLGDFLRRPYWADAAELLYMGLLGLLLLLLLPRFGAAWCLPLAAAGIGGPVAASWRLYTTRGFLVDPVFPAATGLVVYMASSIISYLKTESERRQVKTAFSRYMAPALVEQLAKHPEKLRLGGETREMTFHFCDIRGFTTISEHFDPHGLTQFINRFLTPMTDIILKHQGVIDKYMGDCIMAFWNAPLDDAEHARHACLAALAMHAKLYELNKEWEREARAAGRAHLPIRIGTGLNTGRCVVGNMGSDQRFDYSVLGDDVNLASRLEGQSKTYGVDVVIGPRTREEAPDFAALELDLIKVKGKTVPVRIYALLGGPELAANASFKVHRVLHDRMLAAYRARRWDDARALLEECRKLPLPLEKLYDLYDSRIDAYREQPPPADWDGAFTATSK